MSKAQRTALVIRLRGLLEKGTEIVFAYLHGSFAEGLPFHDIDVAVFLGEQQSKTMEYVDYENELSVTLTRALEAPVDVRALNTAPLGFQFNATRGQVLISRDEDFRLDFVERTWIEYMDFRPISELILREALR